MDYADILEVYAELGIAVVGFSGLVAALKYSTLSKDAFSRIQLSVLLGYGAGGVIWSMVPLILLRSDLDESKIA